MINVIGLGYIGLPTALMMADNGIDVIGTDIKESLVDELNNGFFKTEEIGLNELLNNNLNKNIHFTTEYQQTDKYIIAVPTPFDNKVNKLDSKYLLAAIDYVLDVCLTNSSIIIESTISPGTIDKKVRPFIKGKGFNIGENIHLVHAPERIIPGNMINELKYNSRTIGVDDVFIGERIKTIYESFCDSEIVITDIKTAEMTKVVENTFRDINIAFANELAKICREDNMDVYEIIKIANKHPRVNILQPGPGVGGHCISVDPWFLVGDYPDLTRLVLSARKVNNSMPRYVLSRLRNVMKENDILDIKQVGIYGLTYKENISDIRNSPTLQLLREMDNHIVFGAKVFDPYLKKEVVDNQYLDFNDFLNEIEILIIMVGHDHLKDNIGLISNKILLDTKNIKLTKDYYKL